MAMKAKHAFGKSESIEAAKQSNKIDSFDILFLDGDTDPKIGWLDAQGNTVIVPNKTDLSGVEAELATKATTEQVSQIETELATKATTEKVTEIESKLSTKADVTEVESKIEQSVQDSIASAKSYTDGKVEAAISEHMTKKYEVADVPAGTIVKMNENEIRILCPTSVEWSKQNVGTGGDANCYYFTFKTYVYDDNIVGYIEHLGGQSDEEILTDFQTDEYGRRYQPTWLALAKYDETTGTWNYYGKSSSVNKYIGWDYQIDFYDANGVMVASDSIRINLSNEQCHSSIEPYYVGNIMKDIDTKIEEKIAEVEASYEVIEF